jgi:hypothetical protein
MSRVNAAARIAPTKCSEHAIANELAQKFEWISLALGRVEEMSRASHPVRGAAGQRTERERARERERDERERPLFMLAHSLARSFSLSLARARALPLSVWLSVSLSSLPPSLPPSLPHPSLPAPDTRTNLPVLAVYVRERRFTCPWVCDGKHETDETHLACSALVDTQKHRQ